MTYKNEKKYKEIIQFVEENIDSDPIAALFKLKQTAGDIEIFGYRPELREIEHDIIRNCLIHPDFKTSLTTQQILSVLKTDQMDYGFMIFFNQLKLKDDIDKHAQDIQEFFNLYENHQSMAVLFYNMLNEKNIDYNYTFKGVSFNPSKTINLESNKDIIAIKKVINEEFEKDPSAGKIAIQVFTTFLVENWINIILEKTKNFQGLVLNVTWCLLGKKSVDDLNQSELDFYEFFKK
ncbi:hypothetical protein [[Mycoplasma] gypis]|uniref:Uncharacterized protein n=1 Tax=[Mycoplasma] gypis TaxID=92404 RepID=A0ABZ2RN73_9BACT|nr:hypothetical protein [[Mycoplasma] gypis]MBN0919603.1 hypothetical protein [[Mycoplasma] gypis]